MERFIRMFGCDSIKSLVANRKIKAIKVLNNGRRAISIFKYGLNSIADTLLNPFRPTKINVFDSLSCT